MNIRACIFDLDGVIVDTAKYHFRAWRRLANELGSDLTHSQNEELKGVSRVNSLKKILEWGQIELSEEAFLQYLHQKNEWYLGMIDTLEPAHALTGVHELIQDLKHTGIFVALGSASKNARPILDKLELTPQFDRIVDGNDVKRGKPAPDTFLQGIEGTDILPRETIVFEDSSKGIEGALAGGFWTIGVGDPTWLPDAHITIPNFEHFNFPAALSKLAAYHDQNA